MDDLMRASAATLEVERRLDRYAQVRLSPDPATVDRMRARVMREARLALATSAPAVAAPVEITRAGPRPLYRRAAALLAAAVLTLGVVGGTMAASRAGGPLYDARVALEALALPSDPALRASAEVGRLEARVQEALSAAAAGDRFALDAAMRAYDSIAAEALTDAGPNLDALERIQAALSHHVDVLSGVAEKVPPQAREAIERNIERARERNSRILERLQGGSPNGGSNPGIGPAGGGSGVGPTKTPKPTKPPKSPDTDDPAASVAPSPKSGKPSAPDVDPDEPRSGPPSQRPAPSPRGPAGGAP